MNRTWKNLQSKFGGEAPHYALLISPFPFHVLSSLLQLFQLLSHIKPPSPISVNIRNDVNSVTFRPIKNYYSPFFQCALPRRLFCIFVLINPAARSPLPWNKSAVSKHLVIVAGQYEAQGWMNVTLTYLYSAELGLCARCWMDFGLDIFVNKPSAFVQWHLCERSALCDIYVMKAMIGKKTQTVFRFGIKNWMRIILIIMNLYEECCLRCPLFDLEMVNKTLLQSRY